MHAHALWAHLQAKLDIYGFFFFFFSRDGRTKQKKKCCTLKTQQSTIYNCRTVNIHVQFSNLAYLYQKGWMACKKKKGAHTGIRTQTLWLISQGSLPSDYMEGVNWRELHYSGFPIVMYGRTKSAITKN